MGAGLPTGTGSATLAERVWRAMVHRGARGILQVARDKSELRWDGSEAAAARPGAAHSWPSSARLTPRDPLWGESAVWLPRESLGISGSHCLHLGTLASRAGWCALGSSRVEGGSEPCPGTMAPLPPKLGFWVYCEKLRVHSLRGAPKPPALSLLSLGFSVGSQTWLGIQCPVNL